VPGFTTHPERTYQTEQSAKLTGSIGETGGRHNQQERHRQLQEELVNCRLFACFERPLPTAEMSSIAATRPRCGQIRPHR